MPAGAAIIGRVAVKVIPDTSRFRQEAERELNRLERGLKVTVGTRLDMSGASREFLEELRKINARNRTSDARKIRFHAMISKDGMRDAVVTARRQLQALADQKKIDFKANVESTVSSLPLHIELDQENLRRVKQKLDDWVRDNSPLKIPVHLDLNNASMLATSARLELLTRPRRIPLYVDLDKGSVARAMTALAALSGLRVANNLFTNFRRFFGELDKNIPKIGALALGFGAIAGSVLASSSNLLAFSASLASIAPAALALPGILGGMAIGIGITVAAFKDFNQMLPGVKGQLSALQDIISKNFWDQLQKPMQSMVDTLFPLLQSHLVGTSKALGGFFAGMATGIKDVLASKLGDMFADLDESIRIATTGTGAFVGIITTLGQVGAGYLPRLAQWFVDISTKFNNFLTAAAADGRLQQWIDNGITALKDLGNIIVQIARVFNGLANAAQAAGGSSFAILADTLRSVADVVNSPTFQMALTDVFTSAHKMFENIGQRSGPALSAFFLNLGAVLSQILPIVGNTIGTLVNSVATALNNPAINVGLVNMFKGIETAVTALSPAFTALSPVIAAVANVIGTAAATFGQFISAIVQAAAGPLAGLIAAVEPLIPMLGSALTGAVNALAPAFAAVVGAISGLISGGLLPALSAIFAQLTPTISTLAPLLATVLVGAFNALTPILPQIAQGFVMLIQGMTPLIAAILPQLGPLIVQVITQFGVLLAAVLPLIPVFFNFAMTTLVPLVTTVLNLATTALPQLVAGLVGLFTAVQPILTAFLTLWSTIQGFVLPVLAFLAQFLISTVVMAIEGVTQVINGAVGIIMGILNFFKAAFTGDWSGMWDAVKQILKGAWDLIVGAIKTYLAVGVLGALKAGMALVKSLWDDAWRLMQNLVNSAWSAIQGFVRSGTSTVQSLVSAALNTVKSIFSSVWSSLQGIVSAAWSAVSGAVSSGISTVLGMVRALPGQITSAIGNLGDLLVGAGRALMEGLARGIRNGIGAAVDAAKSAAGAVRDFFPFSPAKRGPFSGRGYTLYSGQAISLSVAQGITDKAGNIVEAARQAMSATSSVFKDNTAYKSGVSIGESIADGITEGLAAVGSSLENMKADVEVSSNLKGLADAAINARPEQANAQVVEKHLHYYAAAGSSLGAEEDLWAATSRARAGW